MKRILVTGAGALLGQGILRLLQISDFDKWVYTADPDARSAGHWLGNHALWLPNAKDERFIQVIKKHVNNFQLDAILIGTDVELPVFAKFKNELLNDFNCRVIVSRSELVAISNNKYLTVKFLKENGFGFPISVMANDLEGLKRIKEKLGFPLFAKPVDGSRSLGARIIENEKELFELYNSESNMVVQQYLSEAEGEYTSGCIVINGECRVVVTLRRDLRDGNTYRAYRDETTNKYDLEIKQIAEKLNPDGPVNLQFRICQGHPIVFEINGRFSGTTPLRQFFGFNEVEAILKHYFFNQPINQPMLKRGVVLRAWSDIFISNEQVETLKREKSLNRPEGTFYGFNLK